jgi:hypothetical protein
MTRRARSKQTAQPPQPTTAPAPEPKAAPEPEWLEKSRQYLGAIQSGEQKLTTVEDAEDAVAALLDVAFDEWPVAQACLRMVSQRIFLGGMFLNADAVAALRFAQEQVDALPTDPVAKAGYKRDWLREHPDRPLDCLVSADRVWQKFAAEEAFDRLQGTELFRTLSPSEQDFAIRILFADALFVRGVPGVVLVSDWRKNVYCRGSNRMGATRVFKPPTPAVYAALYAAIDVGWLSVYTPLQINFGDSQPASASTSTATKEATHA